MDLGEPMIGRHRIYASESVLYGRGNEGLEVISRDRLVGYEFAIPLSDISVATDAMTEILSDIATEVEYQIADRVSHRVGSRPQLVIVE